MLIVGIDEANKGECLNNIVVCATYVQEVDYPKLSYYGNSKSKKIPDFELFKKNLDVSKVRYLIEEIPLVKIDKYNLNDLLLEAQINLLKKLPEVKTAYIDAHMKKELHKKVLKKHFLKINFICDYKMDEKQPLTGISSLIAVGKNNQNLNYLLKKTGINPGSGNLNDSLTLNYIKSQKEPLGLRKSWKISSINKFPHVIKKRINYLYK